MMKRISLLLLVLLIELCVAQSDTCTRKTKCRNKGGQCQPKGTDCTGKIWKGKKFCKEWKDCDCCEPPPDCRAGTKQTCKILKGTCMSQDDFCNGTSVIHKAFCKTPDTCKCCFKDCVCDPVSCTYHNQTGRCSRHLLPGTKNVGPQECKNGCECYITDEDNNCDNERKCWRPDAESAGYHPTGHCRKECYSDEDAWDKCDINPQGSCNCCLRKKEYCPKPNCEAVYENQLYEGVCRIDDCLSMEKKVDFCPDSNCNCCINITDDCENERKCSRPNAESAGYHPYGYCRKGCHSDEDAWDKCDNNPQGGCYCCLRPNGCISKKNQCSGPDDYCVNKFDGDCPKGFGKVVDACFNKSSDCDCCKSLGCTSIGDRCTGKGEYCLGSPFLACKDGYIATEDCKKAVVENGAYKEKPCTCCKPQKEHVCGPYCSSNLKAVECVCMVPGLPCLDGYCYNGFSVDLCGPDSCTCCKQLTPSGPNPPAQNKTAG